MKGKPCPELVDEAAKIANLAVIVGLFLARKHTCGHGSRTFQVLNLPVELVEGDEMVFRTSHCQNRLGYQV